MGRRLLILMAVAAGLCRAAALEVSPCDERPFPDDGRSGPWCVEGDGWLVSIGPAFRQINLAEVQGLMSQLHISPSCARIQQRMFETQVKHWTWFRAKIFADRFFQGSLGLVLQGDTLWCRDWWIARSPAECEIHAVASGFSPQDAWKPPRAGGAVASWVGFDRPVHPAEVEGAVLRGGIRRDFP